ncbi:hypothetical protein HDU97_004548 [Phlyctochytrium planicorne]|nr:hypothetical protein HDU97_004548 [Phlyctochytrium planicorne]
MTGSTYAATLLSNATSTLLANIPSPLLTHIETFRSLLEPIPTEYLLLASFLALFSIIYFEFGVSPIKLVHAKETNPIALVDQEDEGVKKVPLDVFIRERCPGVANGVFYPTPWLWGGDLQTVWASMTGMFRHEKVQYERDILNMPDGGIISMDWCPKIDFDISNKTPIVVILHGLTGGSHESYVQEIVKEIISKGLRAVVCNFRGCAETELKSTQLYSGAYTDDIRYATAFLKRKLPEVPLIGVGFSLGANIMTKFVGEDGDHSPFIACVPIANPYDLLQGSHALHSTWLGREIYSYKMTQGLIGVYQRHAHMLESDPDHPYEPHNIKSAKSLTEFDDHVTRRAFGFRTVHEYYRMGSSAQFVPDIRIPTLFFSALDDPIASYKTLPVYEALANPNVVIATTRRGGHIGWFEGWIFPTRWFQKPVVEFLVRILEAYESLPAEDKGRFLESRHEHLPKSKRGVVPTENHGKYYPKFMSGSVLNRKPEAAAAREGQGETKPAKEVKSVGVMVEKGEFKNVDVQTDVKPKPTPPKEDQDLSTASTAVSPSVASSFDDSTPESVQWVRRMLLGILGGEDGKALMTEEEVGRARILGRVLMVGFGLVVGYAFGRRSRRG